MPTAINTNDTVYSSHPTCEVATNTLLDDSSFTVVPYLYCDVLQLSAAPEIDQCVLSYDYGDIIQPDSNTMNTYTPLLLEGMFVRVKITDTVMTGTPPAPAASIVWYGYIEPQTHAVYGNGLGRQTFVAYGLLRLLELERVTNAVVDAGTGSPQTIPRGLQFNIDEGGEFARRGNRNLTLIHSSPYQSYCFAWETRFQTEWDAYEAVKYLIFNHAPRDASGAFANNWRIDGLAGYINWYPVAEETDGRSVKDLLDALIDRRRGAGYYVYYDPSANQMVLQLFSFANVDIAMPNGGTMKANANQKTLDFENAIDIEYAQVTNVGTTHYHRVTARGARRTTTFTTQISSDFSTSTDVIGPRWDSSAETEYKTAAYGSTGYSSLSDADKKDRNAQARSSDRLKAVYRRYGLNPTKGGSRWDGSVIDPVGFGAVCYVNFDPWAATPDPTVNPGAFNESPLTMQFRESLPLYEGIDYSGTIAPSTYTTTQHPEFIPMFVAAFLPNGLGELVEKLSLMINRFWGCSVGVAKTEPAIVIEAPVPHFLGDPTVDSSTDSSSFAFTWDNQNAKYRDGIPYTSLYCTVCLQLNERLSYSYDISAPATGAPVKELTIDVPDCRYDYVLPKTIVEYKLGKPVQTNGGPTADDRMRLKTYAFAAAVWYGTPRLCLDMKYSQLRALFNIGDLITTISSTYNVTGINTAITSITYEWGSGDRPGSTRLSTGYGSLDLGGLSGAGGQPDMPKDEPPIIVRGAGA